ncbi:restriction endonuclease subunit S [Bifidobacterium longum]|uniref:restriction endonuclease subunit S n=2 Tax=Bifidobacterium longum TaxID=216816 RepID=UPI0027B908DC|nr:restriction endonuclease subunit S [Bifidobacterium longum]
MNLAIRENAKHRNEKLVISGNCHCPPSFRYSRLSMIRQTSRKYASAWEQRKLIMVAPLQRGFDLPAEKIIPGVYPVMMSNGIGAYHNEYKVKGPGVVTGRSGTIGNLQYVESAFWPHNTTLWVTKFYGNHPKFIYYLYEKIDLKRYKAGSGVPTLNRNDVHDTMVFFPASRKEQELISAVLTYLDDLITLHQRKRLSIRQRSPVWS